MPSFTVFKGQESGVPKQSTTAKPDQLTGDNVFVRVTASGVCGTGMCRPLDDPPRKRRLLIDPSRSALCKGLRFSDEGLLIFSN